MAKLTKKSSKKRILQEWIAALKGEGEYKGRFKQGKNELHGKGEGRKKDTFCCLGVLCELAVAAKVIPPAEFNENGHNFEYDGCSRYLPESVREWARLTSDTGQYGDGDYFPDDSLASDNDNGTSFKKIAKIIESKPEGLFV